MRNKYILAVIGALSLMGIMLWFQKDAFQASLASKILRFHVLANSDEAEDQAVKEKVRDAVGVYLKPFLEDADSLLKTKEIVNENMDEIICVARKTLQENGYDYEVKAQIAYTEFPEKTYGAFTFPAGSYEALQIEIGEGEGQNWWCVLYPNMCFRGSVFEVVEDDAGEALREVLSPWEYEKVFRSGKVQLRFKFLEFFQR